MRMPSGDGCVVTSDDSQRFRASGVTSRYVDDEYPSSAGRCLQFDERPHENGAGVKRI